MLLPSQLAIHPFDYVALGHLHRYQNLNTNNDIPVVYAGSIERIDFGERKEEKGFCLISIKKKGAVDYEFIKPPTRPFIQIEVKLQPLNYTEQILKALSSHNIDGAILKILYHLPTTDYQDTLDAQKIEQACQSAMYVAGIIPIRKPHTRTTRTAASINMNLTELLHCYFDQKITDESLKNKLIQRALNLHQQAQEHSDNS